MIASTMLLRPDPWWGKYASGDDPQPIQPAYFVERLRPHFSRFGITRLGILTGLDGIRAPVAAAVRPNSFSLSLSLGKGPDIQQALISAAMEAIECAVAERLPAGSRCSTVAEMQSSGSRSLGMGSVARLHPGRISADQPLHWVQGYGLASGRPLWVPWSLVGLDHRRNAPCFHDAFEVSTDGLASGRYIAEAVLHGLLELIERDAYAMFELCSREEAMRRAFVPQRFAEPELDDLRQRIEDDNCRLVIFDMTTDLDVPAFVAFLVPLKTIKTGHAADAAHFAGCGCSLAPHKAVAGAVLEALQARVAYIAGARDDFDSMPNMSSAAANWLAEAEFPAEPARHLGDTRVPGAVSMGDQILTLLQRLSAAGLDEPVYVPLDTASEEFAVLRVIAPGLQIPLHGQRTQVTARMLHKLVSKAA